MSRLGIGRASDLDAHLKHFGPLPQVATRHGREPGPLVDDIEAAGLRGRGGGWFPTHLKLRAVVTSSADRSRLSRTRHPIVIGNGMEGEPASGKDAVLLQNAPHLVLDGLSLAARTIGTTEAYLAVHRGSPVLPRLQAALDERARAGIDDISLLLVTPPARYVSSEESALAHWVGDGVGTPVYPDRPFQRGAAGRPTLVQNAETLAHIALIARYGPLWFASVGAETAPGTTLVTVGGAVATPGVVEVPTGTPVGEILERCGGLTTRAQGYLTGGYGGGWVSADGFTSVAWDPESTRSAGAVIGASVLWAVGEGVCPIEEMTRVASWMAGESAGQCGPCMFGLPAIADDLRSLQLGHADAPTMERLSTRLGLVAGRGGCKHPDGTARFVGTGLRVFADEVALHRDGGCSAAGRRSTAPGALLPVPATRHALVDVHGKDFA